jgi:hypothetical protein
MQPCRVVAGEITEREPYEGYLIFRGGIPEVEKFIRKFHKQGASEYGKKPG